MKKAAIYARYSTDMQNDKSVEDQIRVVEERAKRDGYEIAGHYTDHGISGASMHQRPGVQALVRDIGSKKFDVIFSEALDRISRDQADTAIIFRKTQFAEVKIHTLSEGEITELHVGLKGTMNALQLKDSAHKVRRGMRGRVENGFSGGGITYGYDVVRKFDERGEPLRGERTINQQEAEVVNRIFGDFAAGHSPKWIAKQLNKEGIPAPSGVAWGPSTIYGNRKRGTGIINNELYVGEMVWNRLRYVKDPDTGKRISRQNPESEWIRKQVPEMRIVPQELWDKVKEIQGAIKSQHKEFWGKQRPKSLFSGMVKCGCCGHGAGKVNTKEFGCFAAFNKGTCDNKLRIAISEVETSVLNALEKHLLDPELCKIYCEEYTRYMNELRSIQLSQRSAHEAELKKRQRDDERMIQMVIDGFATSAAMKDKVNANTARIEELQEILADKPIVPPLLHPNMGNHYRKEVGNLISLIKDPEQRNEAILLIRGLVEKIVLTPVEGGKKLSVDLYGDLAGILTMATGRAKPLEEIEEIVTQVKMVAGGRCHLGDGSGKMVAGARFELTAFRL